MRQPLQFVLQFAPSEIDALAARYGYAQDNDALLAGKRIASGEYCLDNLKVIVNWKSPRRAALIDDNKDEHIAVALKFASSPSTPEAMAVAVLTALHGVGIPMASAILTAINPERYTILDFRALQSLGWRTGRSQSDSTSPTSTPVVNLRTFMANLFAHLTEPYGNGRGS